VEVDEQRFTLQAVAEKRGVVAFTCSVGTIPPYATRRKIERQVARSLREHFIIYVDGERTEQIWQWVRREIGRPLASREHHYTIQQPGDSLIQKLQTIAVRFEEEETLTLVDVTGRVRAAFNVERATKKFYDRFKKERDAFQKFLSGIPGEELERWYVSVMLNRLMFIYFIQKKGFWMATRTTCATSWRKVKVASTPISCVRCSSRDLPGRQVSGRRRFGPCWATFPS